MSLVSHPSAPADLICNDQHGLRQPLLPRLRRSSWHPGSPAACWTGSSESLISFKKKTNMPPCPGAVYQVTGKLQDKGGHIPGLLGGHRLLALRISDVEEQERGGLRVGDNFLS